MNSVKQLRLRLINGVNTNDGLIYSEGFDLMNLVELQFLKKMCKNYVIEGFVIEISKFSKGEYIDKTIENEFVPFLEYICAEENGKDFLYKGENFLKMPYHIIRDSILDVNYDIELLLSIIYPNDIEITLKEIYEIFQIENKREKLISPLINLSKK